MQLNNHILSDVSIEYEHINFNTIHGNQSKVFIPNNENT